MVNKDNKELTFAQDLQNNVQSASKTSNKNAVLMNFQWPELAKREDEKSSDCASERANIIFPVLVVGPLAPIRSRFDVR